MDTFIRTLIPNIMQFVGEYLATKGADAFLSHLKNPNRASLRSVEIQFIQCLDTALAETCRLAEWEYDNHAIEQTLYYTDELVKSSDDLQILLPQILSKAIGHPFDKRIQDIWMDCFVKAVVLPENQELYRTMMYYNTAKPQNRRYSAKGIYDYLSKPFERLTNGTIRHKAENRLHDLVDHYSENDIVSSSDFRTFFQQHIQLILPDNVEYYLADTFETDVYSILHTFYKRFSNFSSSEQDKAMQLIKAYLVCYVDALYGDELVSVARDTVSSSINRMFISFQEQRSVASATSLSGVVFEKAQKAVEDFAANLEKELPFEMEDGKTLLDVYVSPEYIFSGQQKIRDNVFGLIGSFINRKIKTFFEENRIINRLEFGYYHVLFVIGSGGMGKSSLLAKLAYDIRAKGISHRIFFLKFSKLKDCSGNILSDITAQFDLSEDDLRQSVIVLDAYDEFVLNTAYNKDSVMQDFCADLYRLNALAIVTTRPDYIDTNAIGNSISISLCTFSQDKRALWVDKYDPFINQDVLQGILNYQDMSDEMGCELIGIPIILYMVAANKINISQFKSKYALYNRLFGTHGLWMNRRYDENHPLLKNAQKEIYLLILDIALAIFNQRRSLSISREYIEGVIEKSGFEDHELIITLKRCYPLVTYFKSDKNLKELEFAHKSIYEFYVAAKLFNDIEKILNMDMISADSVVEFAIHFQGDCLSSEILEFYTEMIRQKQPCSRCYHQALKMLELLSGSYLSLLKSPLVSNPDQACNAFFNAFTAISKVLATHLLSDYIEVPQGMLAESLRLYLNLSAYAGVVCLAHFNLTGFNFAHMCCKNVDFSYANLEGADLSCGDFTTAIFYRTNLKNANLYAATLSHAVLREADLQGAFLRSVLLNKSDISIFTGVHLDVTQISNFAPEIYYKPELFRIYSKGGKLNKEEKETAIRNVRGF